MLVGEGVEEVRFLRAFLTHLQIKDVQVEHYGGKSGLAAYLKALTGPPRSGFREVTTLGITRDADADWTTAFQSVGDVLGKLGLSVPTAPGLFATGSPRVGVLILPGNNEPGMLEDLCLAAVEDDPGMPCVDEYLECVGARAARQPGNPAKARVHAWLASQVRPDLRLGEAAEKGYWPWESPAFDPLERFLRNL
ncbi:MAG: hypothetical protein HY784_17625 [Chloroflexi bacterium]|nr:hypothetical protein [Chloroflexota bacterium]